MNNLNSNSIQLGNYTHNVLAFRTNGKSVEVVAQGQSAKLLSSVLSICLIIFTMKVVLR